jgi:hypothetical protein
MAAYYDDARIIADEEDRSRHQYRLDFVMSPGVHGKSLGCTRKGPVRPGQQASI